MNFLYLETVIKLTVDYKTVQIKRLKYLWNQKVRLKSDSDNDDNANDDANDDANANDNDNIY